MKFGIVSLEGDSVWLASRLQDEGEQVLMYHAPPHDAPFADSPHKLSGSGIVTLAKTWEQFLVYSPDLVIYDCTDYGAKADDLRKRGFTVFGSSLFFDKLEKQRRYGISIAEEIGMEVPEHYEFGTITQSLAWLKDRPDEEIWYFKSDRELGPAFTAHGNREVLTARLHYIRKAKGDRIKHILQANIEGIALSTAGYWNGNSFVRPWEATLERKAFGNDDTGPRTGCAMNVVWFYPDDPKIIEEEHWDKLTAIFRREQAPPAIVDINAILSFNDGKPYFLEWTPRFGIDSEPTAQRLIQGDYSEFMARLCEGTLPYLPFDLARAALGIRLTVPPYPYEPPRGVLDDKDTPIGVELTGVDGSLWGERVQDRFVAYGVAEDDDGLYCSDPYGLIGVASITGTSLETMNKALVKYAHDLDIADLSYRTDAEVCLAKDLAAVRKAGYAAPLL